jgi:hypothetical protein
MDSVATGNKKLTKIHLKNIFLSLACIGGLVLLPGCTTLNTSETDLQPIAAQTGEIVAKVEFGMQIEPSMLLIRYVDDYDLPAVRQYTSDWDELIDSLRAIVAYSVQLIEIAEDPEAADSKEQLAQNIEKLYAALAAQPSVGPALQQVDIQDIAGRIRSADKFQDAAEASQEAIDPVVHELNELTTRVARSMEEASEEMLQTIDSYYAEVIDFQTLLLRRRNDTIDQLKLLDKAANQADQEAWNELRKSDAYIQAKLKGLNSPTPAAVDKASAVLMEYLDTLVKLRASLGPDFAIYQAEMLELRDIVLSIDSALSVARITINTWDRGHEMFVQGKKTGFAYYTSLLMSYAVKKAGGVITDKFGDEIQGSVRGQYE